MNRNKILDKLIKAIKKTLIRVIGKDQREASDKWPLPKCHIWECDIYSMPFLLRQLFNYFKKAEEKGLTLKDIVKIYRYPTYFARVIFLFGFRPLAGLNRDQELELAHKVAEVLNIFYRGKIRANLYRKNILWDNKKLKQEIKKIHFQKINKSAKSQFYRKTLGQIEGKLYLYTELIYNALPNLGYEVHGPYNLGQQNLLLVREYHDLRPTFWRFSQKFPFERITIYETYKKGKVKVGIDIHGRIFTSKPLCLNVDKFAVTADKKLIKNLKNLTELSQILDNFLNKGRREKASLLKNQIIEKFAWTNFLLLKPLAEKLGEDWRPPKWLLKKIKKLYLTEKEKRYLKLLLSYKLGLKERFDPRVPIIFLQK